MPWSEVPQTEDARADKDSILPVRRFHVWGVPKQQILTEPTTVLQDGTTGPSLPDYGSTHPDQTDPRYQKLRLDDYTVSTGGRGGIIVAVARYSADARFRIQDPPILPEEILRYGGDAAQLEYEIPIARRVYAEGTDTDNRPIGRWEADAFIFRASTARRRAVRRIDAASLDHDDRYFIDRAVGNIHELTFGLTTGGTWAQKFMFSGWAHAQVDVDTIEVRYEWVSDPGTKLLDFSSLVEDPETGVPIVGPLEQPITGPSAGSYRMTKFHPPHPGFPQSFVIPQIYPGPHPGFPIQGFAYDTGGGRVERFLRPPFHALVYHPPADHTTFGEFTIQHLGYETTGPGGTLFEWVSFPGILP